MDFYVVMGRPGARIARRKAKKARIGFTHRVKKEDTIAWFKQRFDGIVLVSLGVPSSKTCSDLGPGQVITITNIMLALYSIMSLCFHHAAKNYKSICDKQDLRSVIQQYQ